MPPPGPTVDAAATEGGGVDDSDVDDSDVDDSDVDDSDVDDVHPLASRHNDATTVLHAPIAVRQRPACATLIMVV
jgi:hypothetical protein